MFQTLDDLKLLSTVLTQFVDNQCEIEIEECGENDDLVRARQMLDSVNEKLVIALA